MYTSEGNGAFPPIDEKKVQYFTLAGSHLTILFRCFKTKHFSSLSGTRFQASPEDTHLAHVLEHGFEYIVLRSDIPAEAAMRISEWRNSDNNTNQLKHDMELIMSAKNIIARQHSQQVNFTVNTYLQYAQHNV